GAVLKPYGVERKIYSHLDLPRQRTRPWQQNLPIRRIKAAARQSPVCERGLQKLSTVIGSVLRRHKEHTPPRKIIVLAALAAFHANAADTLAIFGRTWAVPAAADWKVEEGTLRTFTIRGPLPGPRRPIQFALTDVPNYWPPDR